MLLTLIFFTAINFGIIYGFLYVLDKGMKSLNVEHKRINENIYLIFENLKEKKKAKVKDKL